MKGVLVKEFGPAPVVDEMVNTWITEHKDSMSFEIIDFDYKCDMFPMQDNLGGAGIGSVTRLIVFYTP